MNFFRRRAILKAANYLALTPIKLADSEINAENNCAVILFPRFRNMFMQKHVAPKLKSPYIKLKLDKTASAVWFAIDGKKTVGEIAVVVQQNINAEKPDDQDIEYRLTKFLTLLYEQKIISFKEIQ